MSELHRITVDPNQCGGRPCLRVRDLLLHRKPKDFDIATSARPEDVKRLFRNCRVIGRRFRLAHILFERGKVVEVATFRRNPATELPEDENAVVDEDILIRNDNVFGEAHEDATRRDFTINADPAIEEEPEDGPDQGAAGAGGDAPGQVPAADASPPTPPSTIPSLAAPAAAASSAP